MTTRRRSPPSVTVMENMTVVETSGLSKRYGNGVLAVDSVEMSGRRGEVYGFLGPNGAGKTTTLKMLVRLIRPASGAETVAGHGPIDPCGLARIGSLMSRPASTPTCGPREPDGRRGPLRCSLFVSESTTTKEG